MLFTTAASLIEKLTKAHAEGRLEEKLKLYTAPRLLIIDEIGYMPIDRVGANLFLPAHQPALRAPAPFHSLLAHDTRTGLALIRDVSNHATTAWRQLHGQGEGEGTPLPLVLSFPWGPQEF